MQMASLLLLLPLMASAASPLAASVGKGSLRLTPLEAAAKSLDGRMPSSRNSTEAVTGDAASLHAVEVNQSDARKGAIVQKTKATEWWGLPHYGESPKLRTWEQFAQDHGHLGQTCTPDTRLDRCGTTFTCKVGDSGIGACVPCAINRDCMEEYRCDYDYLEGRNMCIPRDLVAQWHWREAVCTVLIIITAMLSAAAGMGGGGVFVPLCLLFLCLSTKEAIPLSQAMIVGGAIVNMIMFSGDRHPKNPTRSKVDYETVMMLNPGLAAGVYIGVICHIVSPQWITVAVLIVTLVITFQKSLTKGIEEWKKESAALVAAAPSSGPQAPIKIKTPDFRSFVKLLPSNLAPIGLIVLCWCCFFLLAMTKATPCSAGYWHQIAAMLVCCAVLTYAGQLVLQARHTAAEAAGEKPSDLHWTSENVWMYPLMTTVAGFLGGFLGIGGGIVLGPMLLELGMNAEVSQATTAMFVFLSSSLASLQFIMLGKSMPQYVLWFTTWVVFATIFGQTGIDYLLKKYKRTSPIVLSVAGIVGGSLVMMTLVGGMDIYADLMRGADMGFKPNALCGVGAVVR